MAEDTGMQTVGLDLGDRESHYHIIDSDGNDVGRGSVRSTKTGMAKLFSELPRALVVLEVGTHSPWVSEQLSAWHEVVVANSRRTAALLKGMRKNDRSDAEMLARLGRSDRRLLHPIQHRSVQVQQDRAVLELRDGLVKARTQLVNQLRGLLKSLGHRLTAKSYKTIAASMAELPTDLQAALEPTLRAIAALSESIKAEDKRVDVLCERYPATRVVRQVSGVGPVIALGYVLTIEDPGRFRRSRDVGAYLGLVPQQHESGDQQPQLRISKAGDKALRRLLVQGAHYIVSRNGPDSDLKRWAEPRMTRGGGNGKKRTIVAVARKLCVLLHHLWVNGEVYEPLYQANRKKTLAASA